jgi:hypothetical protein
MALIQIEVPDWAVEKVITIFSSNSMIAQKQPDGNWFVIQEGCNQCGECCKQYDKAPFMHEEDGSCPYLRETPSGKYECKLGAYRPYGCSADNPTGIPKYCSIKYEEIIE